MVAQGARRCNIPFTKCPTSSRLPYGRTIGPCRTSSTGSWRGRTNVPPRRVMYRADCTVDGYVNVVRPFLRRRISADGLALDVAQLGEADLTAFMVTRCAAQSRRAAQLTATTLRSLVTFLHLTGAVTRSLARAVPSVAGRRLMTLPLRLKPDRVRRLLAASDHRTLGGRRDFEVITTLARLGLARRGSGDPASRQPFCGALARSSYTARDIGPTACLCPPMWATRSPHTSASDRPARTDAPSSSA